VEVGLKKLALPTLDQELFRSTHLFFQTKIEELSFKTYFWK